MLALIGLWGLVFVPGDGAGDLLVRVGIGLAAFAVLLPGYLLGWMGGGDVKLAVPVFLWAGPDHLAGIAVLVALSGAALGILGEVARLLRCRMPTARLAAPLDLISTERGVPYGVALSLGGALAALSSAGV